MITIPIGWTYPKQSIDWNKTNIDSVKIMIDKNGMWHFLTRVED